MIPSPDAEPGVRELSLHPPHLITSKGRLLPSALIPFCAYQSNIKLLGQDLDELPFTICNQFQPTVVQKRLCYSLNTSYSDIKTKAGKEMGIMMVLDSGVIETEELAKTKKKYQKKHNIYQRSKFTK